MDLCCLQETMWKMEGVKHIVGKDSHFKHFWSGNDNGTGGVRSLLAEECFFFFFFCFVFFFSYLRATHLFSLSFDTQRVGEDHPSEYLTNYKGVFAYKRSATILHSSFTLQSSYML